MIRKCFNVLHSKLCVCRPALLKCSGVSLAGWRIYMRKNFILTHHWKLAWCIKHKQLLNYKRSLSKSIVPFFSFFNVCLMGDASEMLDCKADFLRQILKIYTHLYANAYWCHCGPNVKLFVWTHYVLGQTCYSAAEQVPAKLLHFFFLPGPQLLILKSLMVSCCTELQSDAFCGTLPSWCSSQCVICTWGRGMKNLTRWLVVGVR